MPNDIEALKARLRAATMDFAWADLPDDVAIPAVPLLREAATALDQKEARNQELEGAVIWYENNVAGCRLIHSGGDAHRAALAEDGGKRARSALNGGDGK